VSGGGTLGKLVRAVGVGYLAFALAFVWLGIMGLASGCFTAIWSGVPQAMPGRTAIAYLTAVVCLASGLALLWRNTAAIAARALLGYWLLWAIAFRLPLLVREPTSSAVWWVCGETMVMMSGAWILYAWWGGPRDGRPGAIAAGDTGRRIARVLYGVGLIPFGIAHFTSLAHTAELVPRWLPWDNGWAYGTGAAFIAAGIAVATGVLARPAASLSAWQMGLFTLIVWVPVVLRGANAGDWNEFVDSCALTAAAWVVAESWRPPPDHSVSGSPVVRSSSP
jgi:uncharacterized membrane protein